MVTRQEIVLRGRRWRTDLRSGSILFIGTAATLTRYAGFSILTDPNFLNRGDHIDLGYGVRSRRLTVLALDIRHLPSIDLTMFSQPALRGTELASWLA